MEQKKRPSNDDDDDQEDESIQDDDTVPIPVPEAGDEPVRKSGDDKDTPGNESDGATSNRFWRVAKQESGL
jgi:hypothetical protein